MTPLFAFLFSVPCLTALFMLTFQMIEEHIDNSKPQVPYEGFGRPTAKIQFSSFREIVATETALSPLQSWAKAGNAASTSVTPLAAAPAQRLADASVRQPQPANPRAKRHVPALAKRAALRKPQTVLPLVLPNQHTAAKPPTQPAGL